MQLIKTETYEISGKLHTVNLYETHGWKVTHNCDSSKLTSYDLNTYESAERVYDIIKAAVRNISAGKKLVLMNDFEAAFLKCALWSSCDENGNPLDDQFDVGDLSPECLKSLLKDCKNFQKENSLLLAAAGSDEQNGYDFWLTRNGHGAGFWDRGYNHIGEELTKACKAYGGVDLIVGDDQKIHC